MNGTVIPLPQYVKGSFQLQLVEMVKFKQASHVMIETLSPMMGAQIIVKRRTDTFVQVNLLHVQSHLLHLQLHKKE